MSATKNKNSSRKAASTLPADLLFHADASDPDMLYFSRFSAFDPYLAFSHKGKKIGISHSMEYGRMKAESAFDEVLLLSDLQVGAARRFKLAGDQKADDEQLVLHLAAEYGIKEFTVGSRFPVGLGFKLRDAGLGRKLNLCARGTRQVRRALLRFARLLKSPKSKGRN
jgi:Xaa-Pro aminopeptidase